MLYLFEVVTNILAHCVLFLRDNQFLFLALERNLSVRSRREDLIRRGLLHPDPDGKSVYPISSNSSLGGDY